MRQLLTLFYLGTVEEAVKENVVELSKEHKVEEAQISTQLIEATDTDVNPDRQISNITSVSCGNKETELEDESKIKSVNEIKPETNMNEVQPVSEKDVTEVSFFDVLDETEHIPEISENESISDANNPNEIFSIDTPQDNSIAVETS